MTNEKRLYRSRDALIGGVCAGMANYFNIDPLVARILAVVLTVVTAGLGGVAYLALWLVLPKEPKEIAPLDVEPQSVHSDTYGAVDASAARGAGEHAPDSSQASWYTSSYAATGHVPPPPPTAVTGQTPPFVPGPGAPSPFVPGTPSPYRPATPPSYGGWSTPQQPGAQQPSEHQPCAQQPRTPSRSGVKAALWVGSILLFFGVAALLATFVKGVMWWQYWPLIFVIIGIVRMVVPGDPGCRMRQFVDGLMLFFAGSTLLMMSLGLVAWKSLEFMFVGLWPLLLMMVGFFIIGRALKSPVMILLAGLCFVAFCVVGLGWYSLPGGTEEIVLSAPYGREYDIFVRPLN